jgi:hypothetical protein
LLILPQIVMYYYITMKIEPKGMEASRLRQRKFELAREFRIPENLFPGSLSLVHQRCGRSNCRCAKGEAHTKWILTYMADGKKQVQFIPQHLIDEVRQKVEAGREYLEAVREVFAANAKLFALARRQRLI